METKTKTITVNCPACGAPAQVFIASTCTCPYCRTTYQMEPGPETNVHISGIHIGNISGISGGNINIASGNVNISSTINKG